MNTDSKEFNDLLDLLVNVQSREEMGTHLQHLLSPSELEEVVKRLQIMNMLKAGVPQRKVAQSLGVGIATVSRGARALKQDSE